MIRKRLGKIFIVGLLFVSVSIPAVYMNSIYGYFSVLFFLMLICFAGIFLAIIRKKIQIENNSTDIRCIRGEQPKLGITVTNHCTVLCVNAKAELTISDLFGKEDVTKSISFSLAGRESIEIGFGIDMYHIGIYQVGIKKLRFFDPLHVFCYDKKISDQFEVTVLPKTFLIEDDLSNRAEIETSAETLTATAGGMDYTGVREYVPGDPMKQIHWKLSAHNKGYVTKLSETNRQSEYAVILDFAADTGKDTQTYMQINDCLIETALSIGKLFEQTDCIGWLFYADRSSKLAKISNVEKMDEGELIRDFHFIENKPDQTFLDAAAMLQSNAVLKGNYSDVIVVTSRITEGLLDGLCQMPALHKTAELFLILPAEYNSRQTEKVTGRLSRLEDSHISVHFIRTSDR